MLKQIKSFVKSHLTVKKISAIETPVYQGKLLEEKVALIIGGSGGIGSAIARAFVKNGSRVMLVGTNEKKLKQLCEEIGTRADYLLVDMRYVSAFPEMLEKTLARWGRIDIFVHSAGVHCHEAFGSVTEQTWDDVIDVNLKSMYFACQHVANYMIENKIKGHILNVGSASAAKPGWTPYEISKNGVRALTVGFADKLIKYGIVVNSIAPGPVATEMLGKTSTDDISWAGNPTGRMSTPSEIANWAVFMASDMGDMIVGDTFFVSGGSGTICFDK